MKLTFSSQHKRQVLDITEDIANALIDHHFRGGLVHLFLLHTTAALTTADLDPGTDLDMLDAFEEMVPKLEYRHPHDPEHVPDHILSAVIGTSLLVPVENGELVLGTWQRIVLMEFDGPRERQVCMSFVKAE